MRLIRCFCFSQLQATRTKKIFDDGMTVLLLLLIAEASALTLQVATTGTNWPVCGIETPCLTVQYVLTSRYMQLLRPVRSFNLGS